MANGTSSHNKPFIRKNRKQITPSFFILPRSVLLPARGQVAEAAAKFLFVVAGMMISLVIFQRNNLFLVILFLVIIGNWLVNLERQSALFAHHLSTRYLTTL